MPAQQQQQQERRLECRRFEVAGTPLTLHQDVSASRALQPLAAAAAALAAGEGEQGSRAGEARIPGGERLSPAGQEGGSSTQLATGSAGSDSKSTLSDPALDGVGFAAWQCGFLLADLLLRRPPFGTWQDVRVLDLGPGTGIVGIALALAGADAVLADLPHITPLTTLNVQANCDPSRHRASVVDYRWGQPEVPEQLSQPAADVITGADLVYDPGAYESLVAALGQLAAPHTLVYLAVKARGKGEEGFLEQLAAEGFAVQEVPPATFAEEYREEGATYRVVRAAKLG